MISKLVTFKYFKSDFLSSLVVFFIALPLCLGIALASGAPLMGGLIAGIVGGVVVGLLSGSKLSVSGPAAGLTAVVLAAITDLQNYEVFLVAVVIAGVLQIILSIAKAGIVANYFPSNVINGMLTAIGIIIILKQIPHAFGWDADEEGEMEFFQHDGENTISELMHLFQHVNMGAIIISVICILILIYWDKIKVKAIKAIPSGIVVVVAGILLNELFLLFAPNLALAPTHLVNLPMIDSFDAFTGSFVFPDFSQLLNYNVWIIAGTITIVASLETLLNLEAVDKLDPEKRYSPPNRELFAQGVGNAISGLLGGIPVTSVIVRSSANLNAGAKTNLSAILHGLFLFIAVILLPALINKIPLAALAAILIITGYKLTKIEVFKKMWQRGLMQFLPFIITVVAIVFTDLLKGVGIGLAVSLFLILLENIKDPISFFKNQHKKDAVIKLKFQSEMSFLHKANIKVTLASIPEYSKVFLDASDSKYIDYDILEELREFIDVVAPLKNIEVTLKGFKEKYNIENTLTISDEIFSKKNDETTAKDELLKNLTPANALQLLTEGNFRFVNNLKIDHDLLKQANSTKEGQYPFATILSCIDSRTSAELIFDLGLGDAFSIRIAGNVLNDDILGSMEFATKVSGSKIIVVLGHTNCGAIKGACNHVAMGHLTQLVNKIAPAVVYEKQRNGDLKINIDNVAAHNVKNVVTEIKQRSQIIADLINNKQVGIIGGMYNLDNGEVVFDEQTKEGF